MCLLILSLSGTVVSVSVLDLKEERCLTRQDYMEALGNRLCWVSVDGVIYDVTKSPLWSGGNHMGHRCGAILSMQQVRDEKIALNTLLDYYDDMAYVSKVGRLCEERSVEKPGSCGNKICESGENFRNCPQDCPPEAKDGYCVPFHDFLCDPDCGRKYDPNCICDRNGVCETDFENHSNCPMDCPPAYPDGLCYQRKDGFCDPDCAVGEDADCQEKTTSTSLLGKETRPPESGFGDILPYLAVLIIAVSIAFILYKKKSEKDIERRREEFRKWKEDQGKLGK